MEREKLLGKKNFVSPLFGLPLWSSFGVFEDGLIRLFSYDMCILSFPLTNNLSKIKLLNTRLRSPLIELLQQLQVNAEIRKAGSILNADAKGFTRPAPKTQTVNDAIRC